jgi:hypothetical protein
MKLLSILLFSLASSGLSQPGPQPPELVSENGLLEVTLTVDLVTSLNGTRVAPGYNGLPIGPTLRLKPGDTFRVTLVNNLPSVSAVDRELWDYVYNPESDYVNVSRVYNRLDFIGNTLVGMVAPTEPYYGYWYVLIIRFSWFSLVACCSSFFVDA